MLFSFSEKGPTARCALKTKILFRNFGKSLDKKSILGSPSYKFLALSITICITQVKYRLTAKHSLELL